MPGPLIILDNSINSRLLWPDNQVPANNRYALKVVRQAEQGSAFQVPTIWHYEAAQVACKLLKTGTVSQMDVFNYFNQLALLPIDTDMESHSNTSRTTLALGVQYNLSIYDAAYLELALRKGGVLATNDGQLIGAAKAAGIALLPR